MTHFIARLCRLSLWVFRRSVLLAGLGFCMVYSAVADDIAVSEQTFDCILDWPSQKYAHQALRSREVGSLLAIRRG